MPRAVGSVEWAFVVDFYPELVAPLNGCLWLRDGPRAIERDPLVCDKGG